MRKYILSLLAAMLLMPSCNLKVDLDRYMYLLDSTEMAYVPPEECMVAFSFSWSDCVWSVYENVPEPEDGLITSIEPAWGGGADSYGTAVIVLELPANESSSRRSTEIIVTTIDDDDDPITFSIKLVQLAAEESLEEVS